MQSATKFRQKICLKCRNNHDEPGTLCQICLNAELRRKERIKPEPDHYWVECLIEREGDTVVDVNGLKYRFSRNDNGHCVCNVVNGGHYRMLVQRMGRLYRAYNPDQDYPVSDSDQDVKLNDDDNDWPLGDGPNDSIKEPGNDGDRADNGQTGPDAGRDSTGVDRPGSNKRSGKRDRPGAGTPEVGPDNGMDQPELCCGSGEHEPA